MADPRFEARLRAANLPYDELVRAAAKLYGSAPPPARRTFDKFLPTVPEWAVTSVLLSPDLIPHVLASLETKDCTAARVCKAWQQGWLDTMELRRGLRPGRESAFDEMVQATGVAASPSGDQLILHQSSDEVELRDPTLRLIHTFNKEQYDLSILIMSEDFLYTIDLHDNCFRRSSTRPPFAMVAQHDLPEQEDEDFNVAFFHPCLGGSPSVSDVHPGGLLYAIGYPTDSSSDANNAYAHGKQDEVYAFDALTLELCFRFGGGMFTKEAYGMAAVGDELYVGDRQGYCLQVFSLAGQHLRVVRGDFRQPHSILHFHGRLYLFEHHGAWEKELDDDYGDNGDDEEWPQARHEAAKRILVLTPEGETLQVWKTPEGAKVNDMVIFQSEMLVIFEQPHTYECKCLSLAGI